MNGDKIKCGNCGKIFIDITEIKMQDSRNGKFRNMCPGCYSTNTINLHEDTKRKDKFIYLGDTKGGERHTAKINKKYIKKPNLDVEYISKRVLGFRQQCNVSESKKKFAVGYERTQPRTEKLKDDFVARTGGTYIVKHIKPYTPQELMQQKLKNQCEKLKSKPNNYRRYKGWRYDKKIKEES